MSLRIRLLSTRSELSDATGRTLMLTVSRTEPGHADSVGVLRRRIEALQAQLSAEAESYRLIIATMAETCRTLQARIRILESERVAVQSPKDGDARWRRPHTWHLDTPFSPGLSWQPYLESPRQHDAVHRNPSFSNRPRAGPALWVQVQERRTITTRRRSVVLVFDDAALFEKARLAWS